MSNVLFAKDMVSYGLGLLVLWLVLCAVGLLAGTVAAKITQWKYPREAAQIRMNLRKLFGLDPTPPPCDRWVVEEVYLGTVISGYAVVWCGKVARPTYAVFYPGDHGGGNFYTIVGCKWLAEAKAKEANEKELSI